MVVFYILNYINNNAYNLERLEKTAWKNQILLISHVEKPFFGQGRPWSIPD